MDFTSFSPAMVLVTVVAISLAPFVAVMVTSFTKIVVVLSLLRNALGLQQVPPNVVLNGLAIILSIYVMYPVLLDTQAAVSARLEGRPPPPLQYTAPAPGRAPLRSSPPVAEPSELQASPATNQPTPGASTGPSAPLEPSVPAEGRAAPEADATPTTVQPSPLAASTAPAPAPLDEKMTTEKLLALIEAGKEPLRAFLIRHSSEGERAFFLRSAQRLMPPARRGEVGPTDYIVVIPAFTVSELTAAFQIGFLIFLPFLVIDLVVANILLSLGMMMMSPTTVSLPFKLLLFVLIGGWAKLVHGLVLTYS